MEIIRIDERGGSPEEVNVPVLGINLDSMSVSAGTTGHQPKYFNCNTLFRIAKEINMYVGIDYAPVQRAKQVDILFWGNQELDDFIRALDDTSRELKEMRNFFCNHK